MQNGIIHYQVTMADCFSCLFITFSPVTITAIDLLHKTPQCTSLPTMLHFETEICTCVHISVTKWYIVGYWSDALWDMWDGSISSDSPRVISGALYVSGTGIVHRIWKQSLSLWASQPVIKQATSRYRIQSSRKTQVTKMNMLCWGPWSSCLPKDHCSPCRFSLDYHYQVHGSPLVHKKNPFSCTSMLFKKYFKQDLEKWFVLFWMMIHHWCCWSNQVVWPDSATDVRHIQDNKILVLPTILHCSWLRY